MEIDVNSESIRGQLQRIDRMASEDVDAVAGMTQAINSFNARIGMQGSRVSESVAAVTQMIASIENIDRIAANDRKAAAHAGEYGKGFAVVADEIAKLATASAESSEEIGHTISVIVEKMGEANSTRQATGDAFKGISEHIRVVSDSISEIYGNVNEMHAGSKQILSAMEDLSSSSSEIIGESARIEDTTRSLGGSMGDLGEITIGIRMISSSVQNVTEHSERLGTLGLDAAVAAFRTTDADRG